MGELVIRQAEEKDIAAIAELEKQCFSIPWSYNALRQDILENDLSFYIVAEADSLVCGYMGVWKIFDEGHITNIAVAPDYRRKHIGRAMLTVLMDITGRDGIERFTLEVRPSNEGAIRLYEGQGFRSAGLRKGYYEDNGEDAIIMWKERESQ